MLTVKCDHCQKPIANNKPISLRLDYGGSEMLPWGTTIGYKAYDLCRPCSELIKAVVERRALVMNFPTVEIQDGPNSKV